MEYKTLNNGMKIPMIGFGTWDLHGEECQLAVYNALNVGYRLIDTAQMYNNENDVGNGIRKSNVKREDIIVQTKIFSPDTSYEKAKAAIDKSLMNLGLDYIDIMLIHEPYAEASEMYAALEDGVNEGKIRTIGVSNFNLSQYLELAVNCEIVPAVNQCEAHVYFMQSELHNEMTKRSVAFMGWAPFTEGRRKIFDEPCLKEIASKHGKTSAQIALKFLIQNDVPVIPKTAKTERMKENIDIFDFTLSNSEMNLIKRLDEGKSLFGWYS